MKKFNSIELGIPENMTYKGKSIKSLTDKTGALKSREKKKAVKLSINNENNVEVVDEGEEKDGELKFGTAEVSVPAFLVKDDKRVLTLTPKNKSITTRKGEKSIRLRGTKESKVQILSKGQENAIVQAIMEKLETAPIPKKDISALKAKFQQVFKKEGFRKAVERMREVAKKYKDKEDEKKAKAEAETKAKAEAPAPVKKAKFSYDRAFFSDIDKIMSGQTRGVDIKLYNELVRLQEAGDFYQTPESCLFPVLNDLKQDGVLERMTESFLEPAFGFGKFTRMLIDNLPPNTTIETIDGLEYLRDTYDMIKDKIQITDLYKGDFMEFKPTKNYDLIFMNPPFEGVIEDAKGDRKREKQFWAFMTAKALMLPTEGERISYFLLPVAIPQNIRNEKSRTGKNSQTIDTDHLFGTVAEATRKRIAKALKVDDFEEIQEKVGQLSYISTCDSFMKFGRGGKMSKLGLETAIYKVISR